MKKFFEKKVQDYRFKKAGPGHRMDEEKPMPKATAPKTAARSAPSGSSQAAGGAAIARLENQSRAGPAPRKQLSRQQPEATGGASALPSYEESPLAAVPTVDSASHSLVVHMFCPLCHRSIVHLRLQEHYSACLQEEYLKEPLTASVQMIHTLCKDKEGKRVCIETICKYLENILEHPEEEKYRKIRVNNKAFQERVAPVHGAILFLEAMGFEQQLLPHQDGETQFYVLADEKARNAEALSVCKELLTSTEPLKASLDRNLQVFRPSSRATHFDLPKHFYNLTVEEMKKEQKLRSEALERESVLRTKAMRERDEVKSAIKYYRYVLLRIRMPDGLILQAVFRPLEKLSDVRLVISEALEDPTATFSLSAVGKPLQEDSGSLAQLGLVPSSLLNLSWQSPTAPAIKSDILARLQTLP